MRVSIWGFSILGYKTHFDDEAMEFKMLRMIIEVQSYKRNIRKWNILEREALVAAG